VLSQRTADPSGRLVSQAGVRLEVIRDDFHRQRDRPGQGNGRAAVARHGRAETGIRGRTTRRSTRRREDFRLDRRPHHGATTSRVERRFGSWEHRNLDLQSGMLSPRRWSGFWALFHWVAATKPTVRGGLHARKSDQNGPTTLWGGIKRNRSGESMQR